MKNVTRITVGLICTFILGTNALAFKTFSQYGGAVHESITRTALGSLGVSQQSMTTIDGGSTPQDIPGRSAFTDESHHCDNCAIKAGRNYVESCYTQIAAHLCKAKDDPAELKYVLDKFGELIHTTQDFYAHSNYVELALKQQPSLAPSAMSPVDWNSLSSPSSALKTGYFYYVDPKDCEDFMLNSYYIPVTPARDEVIAKLEASKLLTPGTSYMPDSS